MLQYNYNKKRKSDLILKVFTLTKGGLHMTKKQSRFLTYTTIATMAAFLTIFLMKLSLGAWDLTTIDGKVVVETPEVVIFAELPE